MESEVEHQGQGVAPGLPVPWDSQVASPSLSFLRCRGKTTTPRLPRFSRRKTLCPHFCTLVIFLGPDFYIYI